MSSYLPSGAILPLLERKPDLPQAVARVYAWYEGHIIDRVPVRFTPHNVLAQRSALSHNRKALEARWMDTEQVLIQFESALESQSFLGETFPLFIPNLGPNVYAAFYGSPLQFEEETSWAEPILDRLEDASRLQFQENAYYHKKKELTEAALARCHGSYLVGYTDLHPGMDCLAAWRKNQSLLMDLYDEPDAVKQAMLKTEADFHRLFDLYDGLLKSRGQISISWMGIPSLGTMHIPSCDFAAMISTPQFEEFCLPAILDEMKGMTHNIFHVDGPGVARHLDTLLGLDQIQAFQWVQGVNDDKPIAQWIPLIQKIRSRGKSVVLNIESNEIPCLMEHLAPEGLFLCMAAESRSEQEAILALLSRWTQKGSI